MLATWRQLPDWPYEKDPKPKRSGFGVKGWQQTLLYLEEEVERIKGSDIIIGVVALPNQFNLDGRPRGDFKVLFRGAEVGFTTPERGRLAFHTDHFLTFQENLRAITLGLAALRAIERYGIADTQQQYEGFALLPSGGPDPERGHRLVMEAGSVAKALKQHHPDHGGNPQDLADVMAYRDTLPAYLR